jgi:hypothetical protein
MQADSASRRVFGIMLKEVQALTRKPFSVPRASFVLAAVLTLGMALTAIPRGLAQPPLPGTFTSIDFPGASFTQAQGINPRGDIVGRYDSAGMTHGFLFSELPNRERATASEKKGETT